MRYHLTNSKTSYSLLYISPNDVPQMPHRMRLRHLLYLMRQNPDLISLTVISDEKFIDKLLKKIEMENQLIREHDRMIKYYQ